MDNVLKSINSPTIQAGLTLGSTLYGAQQASAMGNFQDQQYQLQAQEAQLQGTADEINQRERTLRAVASIRAAAASSGVTQGGSTATMVNEATRQGNLATINARDSAGILSGEKILQGQQYRMQGKAKSFGLLWKGGQDLMKSGVLVSK